MPDGTLSLLDNIRISNGSQSLINYFREIKRCDRQKAIDLINAPGLEFGTLYVLKSEISGKDVRGTLAPSYTAALELADRLAGKPSQRLEKEMRESEGNTAPLLEWMFRTGSEEEPDSGYELLMERIACLLVKCFNNRSILPELANLIFSRNRRGALIHELTWAFFEACRIESLALIAYRLNSSDMRDVRLARKLLGFIPDMDGISYDKAVFWLSENHPFLYYTGESLHLDSRPQHYRISLPAKYLCTPVSPSTGEPAAPFGEADRELLSRFGELDELIQRQLADFSWQLYRSDNYRWKSWIGLAFEDQAVWLSHMTGGLA